jgi:hypothetical protein
VIGGTPGAVRYAQIVRQWTHYLAYFTPPDALTNTERTQLLARAIGVVEGTIEQLVIDETDHLRGVQMDDGCVIPRDALVVPPRFVPNNTLLLGLGCDIGDWLRTLTPVAHTLLGELTGDVDVTLDHGGDSGGVDLDAGFGAAGPGDRAVAGPVPRPREGLAPPVESTRGRATAGRSRADHDRLSCAEND